VTNVQKELSQDHEEHELQLQYLTDALEARRPMSELRECWADFEDNLLDHLATEERYLFKVTAQAHRLEIETLRSEHRQIREAASEVSLSLELNAPNRQALDELQALLRSHSEHEQRSLHHWLELDEGILARRGLLEIRSRRERSASRLRVAAKISG
jgi:iron-sulfur cluster repair protein YtfE (RIC family)